MQMLIIFILGLCCGWWGFSGAQCLSHHLRNSLVVKADSTGWSDKSDCKWLNRIICSIINWLLHASVVNEHQLVLCLSIKIIKVTYFSTEMWDIFKSPGP